MISARPTTPDNGSPPAIDFATITGWVRNAGYAGAVEVEIFNQDVWDAPGDLTLATLVDRFRRYVLPHL